MGDAFAELRYQVPRNGSLFRENADGKVGL
jgi:hypothetical protein